MSVELQQSEIGAFPSSWKIGRVDSAFDIQQGKQVSKRNLDGESICHAYRWRICRHFSAVHQ